MLLANTRQEAGFGSDTSPPSGDASTGVVRSVIGLGGGQLREIIEGNVPSPGQARLFAKKSRFSSLAHPGDDYDGHFFEG